MINQTITEVNTESEKAHRQRLTVNSKRTKKYFSPFNLFSPEDYRLFCHDPAHYVEQISLNARLSLRALVHNLAQGVTTPSQRHIGNANGVTRQSVSAHFGVLESADIIGSRYNFKQNSSYCLNGIFYDKKIARKLRFLLPELYLGVCFTLYNSKEYYTPLYVPNDSPDPDLFNRYPANRRPCIPLFNVSVKKDRVSPPNYNLIRGGIYEEGDQKGDIENKPVAGESMDNCVQIEDPYKDFDDDVMQNAYLSTICEYNKKELSFYDEDVLIKIYEKQLVKLREVKESERREVQEAEDERKGKLDESVDSILNSIINGGFLNTKDYAVHKIKH